MLTVFTPGRLAALALALVLASAPALAQRGWSFSPHVYGTGIVVDDIDDAEAEEGGGIGLRVGLGVSKTVTLYLSTGAARVESDGELERVVGDIPVADLGPLDDDYTLVEGELGAQFNLLPSGQINPFLRTGLRGTSAILDVEGRDDDDDPRLTGGGLTLGVGAEVRLSRKLGLELALEGTGGRFEELQTEDADFRTFEDIEFASARASLGLVWRPFAKERRRRGWRH